MDPGVYRAQLAFAVQAMLPHVADHDATSILSALQSRSEYWRDATAADVSGVLQELATVGTQNAAKLFHSNSAGARRERQMERYAASQGEQNLERAHEAAVRTEVAARLAAHRTASEASRVEDEASHPRTGVWKHDAWLDDTLAEREAARQRWTEAQALSQATTGDESLTATESHMRVRPSAKVPITDLDRALLFEVLSRPDWAVVTVSGRSSIMDRMLGKTRRWAGPREFTIVRRSPSRLVVSCPAEHLSLVTPAKYERWSYWPSSLVQAYGVAANFADMSAWPVREPAGRESDYPWTPGVAIRAFNVAYTVAEALHREIGWAESDSAGSWALKMWRHGPPEPTRVGVRPPLQLDRVSQGPARGPEIGRCEICDRPLYSEASTLVGHGPQCARRYGLEPPAYDRHGRRVTTVSANAWAGLVRAGAAATPR